jgi:hypothetical protein
MRLVLIDTCIWVPFFSRLQSAEKQNVDALLDDDRATHLRPRSPATSRNARRPRAR